MNAMQTESGAPGIPDAVSASNQSTSQSSDLLQVVRNFSLGIILFTGFTALVYEVTWHYYLGNLLGSQARSTAIILASFLGGLAVGYQLFGRYSHRGSSRGLLRACGVVEIGIGFWAFLFPWLYEYAWQLQLSLGENESLVIDILLAFGLIGPPTILMGGSLPLLTQGLSKNLDDATGYHSKLYIINTLGAFLGALWAGFILIPVFGLSSTLVKMGYINVILGAVLVCLGSAVPQVYASNSSTEPDRRTARSDPQAIIRLFFLCFYACTAGLVSISAQTVLARVLGLSVGSSPYTFSLVVSSFILVLAFGAAVLADRPRKPISVCSNQLLMGVGFLAIYALVPYLPYWGHIFRALLTSQSPNFWVFHLGLFIAITLLIAMPVGALGANLPLLFRESRDRAELLGGRVGLIYGANAVGCLLGAIFGGYLALKWLNLDDLLVLSGTVTFFTLWIMALRDASNRKVFFGSAALVGMLLFGLTSRWEPMVMGKGVFNMSAASPATFKGRAEFYKFVDSGAKMVAYKDDPNTTVGVLGYDGKSASIMINGKSDGSTSGNDRRTTKLLAHLPALLQTSTSDRAAIIGFGTGITVGALAKYDFVKQIDLCEISAAVRNFSHHFDPFNNEASKSSKITWRMGDAYRFLLQSSGNYSMILSEPSNPWVAGVERLYTSEFYEVTRKKLAPGGIFAQWFHTYNISDETFALVLRTFRNAFSDVHIFGNAGDVILIGSNEPLGDKNIEKFRVDFEVPWVKAELSSVGFSTSESLIGYENLAPWGALGKENLQTLDHPRLSHMAGRDRFVGADVNVQSFGETPKYKGWTRRSFFDSLIGRRISQPMGVAQFRDLAKAYCVVTAPGFFQGWYERPILCRGSLIALAVRGDIQFKGVLTDRTVSDLKYLSDSLPTENRTPPAASEAVITLRWLTEYGSPFLLVDPIKLKTYASRCDTERSRTAVICRIQLSLALANSGFLAEAKDEVLRLKNQGIPIVDTELWDLARESVGLP